MDPITINLNVNLPEKQAEWICSAIACLAQIIDQASRTAGTPFPPAQVNMTQHGANSTQIAQVANVTKAAAAEHKPTEAKQPDDEPAEPAPPKHTHEDVRNLYIELTHQDKKKEATTIIRKYSAKVPELPEDKLDAVYAELLALKAPEEDNDTDT
jgi:hypothetical protein